MGIAKILMIMNLLLATDVFAEVPPCLQAYRQAYLEIDPPTSQSVADAKTIYVIYFDFINDIDVVYEEAEPLFHGLPTATDRTEVLKAVQWSMRTGELCSPNGETKTIQEVIEVLRQRLQKAGN